MGCGCWLCANPRKGKWENRGLTRAEMKSELNFNQQLEELEDAYESGLTRFKTYKGKQNRSY
jgi:hypothetical protein